MRKIKYIVTKDEKIIIFSDLQQHNEFEMFNPIAAGFIQVGISNGEQFANCYGESISLRLKSRGDKDTKLAQRAFGFGEFAYI